MSRIPVWIIAAILLGCSACIHLEQTIMLNGDGSVVVRYSYSIAEESTETMQAGRRVITDWQDKSSQTNLDWFTDEASVRRHFSSPGLVLRQYRSFSKGGRRHVEIMVVAEAGAEAINSGVFGAIHCARTPEGKVRLWADIPQVPPSTKARFAASHMAALCDDLYLRLEFQVPGKISAGSAPTTTRRRAIWQFDPASAVAFLQQKPDISCTFSAAKFKWSKDLPVSTD